MNMIRFNQNPISLLNEILEDFDRNFVRPSDVYAVRPTVNVVEKEDSFVIDVAAPGLKKEDFRIKLDNQLLTISAEVSDSQEEKKEKYVRREFWYGSFERSFNLPKTINLEQIKADYNNGILSIVLPKKEEAKVAINREIAIS
ncbi:MAG TPA: Hsp20/alpha crystallin family protein [Bacteroidales bacterium]|nr:Hsp20/alpha crystallin family protein [Bacteroidales bacterium]